MKDKESDKSGSPTLKSSWRVVCLLKEGVKNRGVSMKTEVELVLSEMICSITDMASDLDGGITVRPRKESKKERLVFPYKLHNLPTEEKNSATSALICSAKSFCSSEMFPVHPNTKSGHPCRSLLTAFSL